MPIDHIPQGVADGFEVLREEDLHETGVHSRSISSRALRCGGKELTVVNPLPFSVLLLARLVQPTYPIYEHAIDDSYSISEVTL